MSVDDIVQLTIVVSDASLTRPGFGTPLALLSKVPAGWGVNKVRTFSKLSELTDLGFTSSSAGYKLAVKIKSQKPAPATFKFAKRDTAPSQSLRVKCLSGTEGDLYSVEVGVDGGATTEITRTVPSSSSATAEATAIAALINAVTGVDATNGNAPAVSASLVVDGVGPGRDGEVTYTAVTAGTAGNAITVAHVVAGTNTPLSVGVVGSAITVNLATDIGGDVTSTAQDVVDAITADDDANDLVTAAVAPIDDDGDALAAAFALDNLEDGAEAGAATDTITVTPVTSGTLVNLKSWNKFFTIQDMTADPGVSDDLDDALAEDGDWYGVLLDSNSEAEIKSVAAWVEANAKLFCYSTSDSGCADPAVTTDVASDLKLLGYARTFGIYNANESLGFSAAAWMARGFAFDPGKITWAFKNLTGIATDKLTTGQQGALEGKNLNFYTTKYGKAITWDGKLASGEFVDVTHGIDWLDSEMRIQVFATVSGLPKLPFTIHGLGAIESTIRAVLKAGVRQGLLVDNENLTVTMPTLAEIDAITKAARLVPNIGFTADLAGAIHKTKLDGSISH